MADEIPSGRTLDMDFMFTKLIVHDLEASAAFYTSVFGLIEMHRLDAKMTGRAASEIVYMPTYPGGPMFVLAKFHDAPKPVNDELILGFATKDLEAFLERVERAGGRIVEPLLVPPGTGFRHAFVTDIEGHLLQVSQRIID